MSWEQMSADTKPCPCGKGTITYYMDIRGKARCRTRLLFLSQRTNGGQRARPKDCGSASAGAPLGGD
jgi:hypothetical protein